MALHPGPEKRRVRAVKLAEFEPIRRALQDNQDWYEDLVEHSHDLLCVHDLAGRLLAINPAPALLLGYSVEEILQIPMRDLVPPEFRDQFDTYLKQIERAGEARGLLSVMTRSGERRIWEYHNTLRAEGVDSPVVRGIAHDVTDQWETEKRLREVSERLLSSVREGESTIGELKLFRTLVDQCNDAIEVVDGETLRFLDVNQKACAELGYTREELLSLRVFDINPVITESSVEKIKQELRKSGSFVMESVHRRKDGSIFPVEVSLRRVQLERAYVVNIVRNISDRKQSEARLREYERVVEGLEEKIMVVDRDYRYVIANRTFLNHRGLEREKAIGHRVAEIVGEEVFEKVVKRKMDECFQGKAVQYELKLDYPMLGEREVLAKYFPIEGPTGIDRIACILQDITERKQTETRLREYERVVEGLEEAIVVIDRDYRYVIANRALLKYRRIEKEQVIGRTIAEVTGKEAFETVFKPKLDECFQGKVVRFDFQHNYSNLGERDLVITYFPIEGPTGVDRIAAIVRDVTERNRAEQTLRESEAYLAEAQRLTHTGSGAWRVAGRDAVHLSEEWYRIYGFDPREGLAAWEKRLQRIHPEDRDRVGEAKDRAIREKSDYEVDHRIVLPDGMVKYTRTVGHPVLNASGDVVQFVHTMMDITERKRAEEALRRSEESYRLFVSQSSEGIFREEMDAPVSIDLPEDELIHHILYDSYMAECNDALARMYGLTSGKEFVGKRFTEVLPPEDPRNIEMTREYIRSGFRVLGRESHEVDIHGNPKVFANSMIGTVENGMLVRTWGIQRDITEKVKSEERQRKTEETLRENFVQLQNVTEELRLAKEKLFEEKLYLEEAIDTELGFGEIIGSSSALKEVMAKVAKVAPSDASVLLLGETGTGKELVARALHRKSQREGNSFIKLNCAAIPSGLLESELFGHEKGSFTGAVARKRGRLELADRGTLFLDEIGEIPLSLQPKLLRVLQDQEFERLGGTQTLKVNFRLLAATNRDLLQSVRAHEFRSDLYYRLNVFPILIPPLRERREDIRPLVEHFVRKFAGQTKKSITHIPSKAMETLVRWDWPGNIRELENFMERSVILTPGSVLQAPLTELEGAVDKSNGGSTGNLRDTERERIIRVLRDCHGQLGGPDGAAARLGLKRTTLQSKLDHLGIKPGGFRG